MSLSFSEPLGFDATEVRRASRQYLSRMAPGVAAFALCAAVGAGMLYVRLPAPSPLLKAQIAAAKPAPSPKAQLTIATTVAARPLPKIPANSANPFGALETSVFRSPFGAVGDPKFSGDFTAHSLAEAYPPPFNLAQAAAKLLPADVPLPPKREVAAAEDVTPLPPSRPAEFKPSATMPTAPLVASAPADNRSFVERLLGGGAHEAPAPAPVQAPILAKPASAAIPPPAAAPTVPPPSTALGYAASESPGEVARTTVEGGRAPMFSPPTGGSFGLSKLFSGSNPTQRYDQFTAVYDVSAHMVYLPDGTRLEAHSGLGERLDDVRHFDERGRGPTPPHIYSLTPREQLFHGVEALRLNPVGEGGIYGRAGLLAHSYMLGPNGDSNGCVSFKDYDAFLHAYKSGQVKKLVVVARLD